ncbi:uncharacterized protein PRCAT00003171001 [Priceomyces carsonii]|uniref:uncharacterized protein n=1 Tax=Priceomyces carsonii TaxID=28549 RepID=UPI002ED86492|nr:unnamed protein product [Priceomyces carsonii]
MKLVRFLMSMPNSTNQPVTVELKNGNSINGQILSCSPLMNLSLKNIKLVQPHQDPQLLQYINIRGNQIRQIILPDDLNIESILSKSVVKIKGNGSGPGAKSTTTPTRGRPMKPRGGRGDRGRGF